MLFDLGPGKPCSLKKLLITLFLLLRNHQYTFRHRFNQFFSRVIHDPIHFDYMVFFRIHLVFRRLEREANKVVTGFEQLLHFQ